MMHMSINIHQFGMIFDEASEMQTFYHKYAFITINIRVYSRLIVNDLESRVIKGSQ